MDIGLQGNDFWLNLCYCECMIVAKNKSCIAPFILKMRKTLLTLVFVISNGCVANVLSSRDVENHYNSIVGTKIEPAMYTSKYGWNKINEGTESYEVEMIKKSGCSYAIKIAKVSNIVLSWRYTSARETCDGNYIQRI